MPCWEGHRLCVNLACLFQHLCPLHRPGKHIPRCWWDPSTSHPIPTRTIALLSLFGPQQAPGSVTTSLLASTQHGWRDSVLLLVLKAACWPVPTR